MLWRIVAAVLLLAHRLRPPARCTPQDINALEQHIRNLLTPSTPYFFNTLYDPYREGAAVVRGYPFSLREGVPTVISHGLWLNIPDYDAPTQVGPCACACAFACASA